MRKNSGVNSKTNQRRENGHFAGNWTLWTTDNLLKDLLTLDS
jgi:hypothetical protein